LIIFPGIFIIGLGFLLVASITDIQTREVPDWLSFSFLFTALFTNLAYSIIISKVSFIINSIVGLILAFVLGLILYYTGQWGGGDSKILIGIFALIGINATNIYNLILGNISLLEYISKANWIMFFIIFAIVGGVYGIIYSLYLILAQPKNFRKALKKLTKNKEIHKLDKIIKIVTFCLVLISLMILGLLKTKEAFILIIISLIPIVIFYTGLFAKAIDTGCMNRKISANKLTIGDWVIKNVYVPRKTKALLFDWHKEHILQTENKIKMQVFEKKIILKYIKQVKGFWTYLQVKFSKKKLDDNLHLIRALLMTSSKTKLIQRAKQHGLSKNETNEFLDFLEKEKIYFDKMCVCGFQNTGLGEEQIILIKQLYKSKKINKVLVKIGIPFIPSFLIGFVIFYILGTLWTFLL